MKALVLAGGGSKGAYEIGVWKALRKLHMKFDIVTGTSIGALNGALIVQGTYRRGMHLWLTTNFYNLFGKELEDLKDRKKAIKIYSKNLIKQKGIAIDKYDDFVNKWIDLKKFYDSKIDYGIVTYNYSSKKPYFATKNSIKRKQLCDFIVASTACFPALGIKEIDGEKYIDGGYYDTLPINLAIDMGADEIVAVELNSIGLRQKVKDKNKKITYIKPNCDLGNFLIFDKKIIRKNIRLGYNDAMKVFDKLDGQYFTFKKNDLEKNYKKYGKNFAYFAKRLIGINTKRTLNQLTSISLYKKLVKNSFDDKNIFNKSLELLGEIFEVPNDKIYNVNMYNHILKTKFANYDDDNLISYDNIKNLNFNKVINRKHIVKYIYSFMLNPVEYHKELSSLCTLFPSEFMGALYLYTIS